MVKGGFVALIRFVATILSSNRQYVNEINLKNLLALSENKSIVINPDAKKLRQKKKEEKRNDERGTNGAARCRYSGIRFYEQNL